MGSGGQIFVSQFYGKGDLLNLRRVMGVILTLGIFVSLAAFVGARFFPGFIVGLFSNDEKVVTLACEYLKIVSWSYIFTAVSFIYQVVLRSTDSPRLPVYSCAMALVINIFFNWVLIFGHLGFPAMGIQGAALATLIARVAETAFTLAYAYIRNLAAAAKIDELTCGCRYATSWEIYYLTIYYLRFFLPSPVQPSVGNRCRHPVRECPCGHRSDPGLP